MQENGMRIHRVPKAIVDTVEKDEEKGAYILKCSGTDLDPIYKVEVYEEEEDREFDMTAKFKELQAARSFDEEVSQFYVEKDIEKISQRNR